MSSFRYCKPVTPYRSCSPNWLPVSRSRAHMAKHCLAHCGAVRSTPSHCRYAGPACCSAAPDQPPAEARLQAIAALNQRCKAPRDCRGTGDAVRPLPSGRTRCTHAARRGIARHAAALRYLSPPGTLRALHRGLRNDRPGRRRRATLTPGRLPAGGGETARDVAIKPLLEQGHQGAELGKALAAARLEALRRHCQQNANNG